MAATIAVDAEPLTAYYWDELGADDVGAVIDDIEVGDRRGWINTGTCVVGTIPGAPGGTCVAFGTGSTSSRPTRVGDGGRVQAGVPDRTR